jgi:ABC-type multidrug transport system fused ATPase/permease subunit
MFFKDKRIKPAWKIVKSVLGDYKRHIVVLIVLGLLGGVLEGICMNALIPLFSIVANQENGATDAISRAIAGFFEFINIGLGIKSLLIFIILLFIGKLGILLVTAWIKANITANFQYQNRTHLLKKTLSADWLYLMTQKVGYLEMILNMCVGKGSRIMNLIGSIINTTANALVYTVVALNISATVTMFSIVVGLLLFLALKPMLYKMRKLAEENLKIHKKVVHFVNQTVIDSKNIKVSFVNKPVLNKAKEYFEKLKSLSIRSAWYSAIYKSIIQPISIIYVAGVFAFSYLYTDFNFVSFIVLIYLIRRIFDYMQAGQRFLSTLVISYPYLKRIADYKEKMEDNQKVYKSGIKGQDFSFKRSIEFDNVSFNYEKRPTDVLSKTMFKIQKGEMVGIVGESGAGKTTLVDLFLRLFKPSSGAILVDDVNIDKIGIERWCDKIGYVMQDIFLVNDTIANNIKFYNSAITKEDMIDAAKKANIYDFIMARPKQFETNVGERGVSLSGGQRQRIVLARALARKPEILILDEATSSLDSKSEALIQEAIEKLKRETTILVIAHRESTIKKCDRVLELKDGTIAEKN